MTIILILQLVQSWNWRKEQVTNSYLGLTFCAVTKSIRQKIRQLGESIENIQIRSTILIFISFVFVFVFLVSYSLMAQNLKYKNACLIHLEFRNPNIEIQELTRISSPNKRKSAAVSGRMMIRIVSTSFFSVAAAVVAAVLFSPFQG